jgi:hypothetical protein
LGHFHLILLLSIIDWMVSTMVIYTDNYYNLVNLRSSGAQEGYLTGRKCALGRLCHGTVFPQKPMFNWGGIPTFEAPEGSVLFCRRLLLDPILNQLNSFQNFTSFFPR